MTARMSGLWSCALIVAALALPVRAENVELTGPLKVELKRKTSVFLDRVWLDRNKDGRFEQAEVVLGENQPTFVIRNRVRRKVPGNRRFRCPHSTSWHTTGSPVTGTILAWAAYEGNRDGWHIQALNGNRD